VSARLPSRLLVTALMRRVQSEGGFATVVQSGDADAGAIMLQCTKMGRFAHLLERRMAMSGDYQWSVIEAAETKDPAQLSEYLAKILGNDPDMWLVELDIANPERFVAELGTIG